MKNEILDGFKSRIESLDWYRAIILIISINLSLFSSFIDGEFIYRLPFLIGSVLCLVLFYFGEKFWIYIFSVLLLLKVLYILPPFFVIFEFQLFIFSFNVLALVLNIVHLNLNEILIKDLLARSKKMKKDNSQSRVERFEFKYRYKSLKQLNEIIEDKDLMTKEEVQAATNLINKNDTL